MSPTIHPSGKGFFKNVHWQRPLFLRPNDGQLRWYVLARQACRPASLNIRTPDTYNAARSTSRDTYAIAQHPRLDSLASVRPVDIQQIGDELAIKWDDATESFITLEQLRRHCPCAGCKGEMDIMGNVYRNPTKPFPAQAFELRRLAMVGGYAIQPVWGDGHSTGLFAFDYLRKVAASPDPDRE